MAEATTTKSATNYTAEMVAEMIEMYNEVGNDGLEDIATAMGKTASPKSATSKTEGPSKKEILRDIESLGFDVTGFEGATKMALARLKTVVAQ